ncbi:MAG TPA: transglycosylase family protein [Mycobacteriales bacterium]
MGAHTRPRNPQPGRHRGDPAPLIDVDLGAAAGKAGAVLATGATATTLVVTGAGAAAAAPSTAARASDAATASDFAALRACESGGNYGINTGNGYYGAYQFNLRTWRGLGYGGLPSSASPATQDEAAARLQALRGWEPWPACSRKLGLGTVSRGTTRGSLAPPKSSAEIRTVSTYVAGPVPAFPGTTLTTALESQKRSDVLVWQSRMARRGWHITVDGYFGPQSASIARQFAVEKRLPGRSDVVDAVAWSAAWTAPIT